MSQQLNWFRVCLYTHDPAFMSVCVCAFVFGHRQQTKYNLSTHIYALFIDWIIKFLLINYRQFIKSLNPRLRSNARPKWIRREFNLNLDEIAKFYCRLNCLILHKLILLSHWHSAKPGYSWRALDTFMTRSPWNIFMSAQINDE
jgi:hypothetical protein